MITAHRQETEELVKQGIKNGACLYMPLDMNDTIKIIGEMSEKIHKLKD